MGNIYNNKMMSYLLNYVNFKNRSVISLNFFSQTMITILSHSTKLLINFLTTSFFIIDTGY